MCLFQIDLKIIVNINDGPLNRFYGSKLQNIKWSVEVKYPPTNKS